MKKLSLIIVIIFISTFFLSGCVTPQGNLPTSKDDSNSNTEIVNSNSRLRSSNAEFIGSFVITADEKVIESRFSLLDGSKEYVVADGTGTIKIRNSEGEEIYSGTINPKREDFGSYTLMLTGEDFEAYVWEIPVSKVKKSSSSTGTMYLNFKTKSAEFEEITADIWGLPTYSDEELAELNEQEFLKDAVSVNKKLSRGSFEVTVEKVGFYEPMVTWGEPEEYFRVDMEVKNIGNEKDYFSPSGLVILDNQGNQFETEYGGTLDTYSNMYPGIKKSGHIIFKKIPSNTQAIKLIFELGHNANWDAYEFEYNIPLTR